MAFNGVSYFPIFGIPLIIYLGAATLLLLFASALTGHLALKHGAKFKRHKFLAIATLILGVLHAGLIILASV